MAKLWNLLSRFEANDFCVFCKRNTNDEFNFGKIYQYADVKVHYFCLLFATHLRQNGRDTDGLLGFLIPDIRQELERNKKVVCFYCKATGAACSCGLRRCSINFHFPCGLENNSFHTFMGQFRSFCSEHSRKPSVPLSNYINPDHVICVICLEQIKNLTTFDIVHASCCNSICFHKQCIQKMALNAGYFFKCPNCNNKKEFRKSMLKNGIYIPDQDATWELTPNSFSELYEQYSLCDATICFCPSGRSYSDSKGSWVIIRCNMCGSQGLHRKCGENFIINKNEWICLTCSGVGTSTVINDNENGALDINHNGCTSARAIASSTRKQNRIIMTRCNSLFGMKKRKYSTREIDGILRVTPVHERKTPLKFKKEKRVRCIIDGTSVSILQSCKDQLKQAKVMLSATSESLHSL